MENLNYWRVKGVFDGSESSKTNNNILLYFTGLIVFCLLIMDLTESARTITVDDNGGAEYVQIQDGEGNP